MTNHQTTVHLLEIRDQKRKREILKKIMGLLLAFVLFACCNAVIPAMVILSFVVLCCCCCCFFPPSFFFCFSFVALQINPSISVGSNAHVVKTSGSSKLFRIRNTGYAVDPYLIKLKGSRHDIGRDYAALLHKESSDAMTAFLNSIFAPEEQVKCKNLYLPCFSMVCFQTLANILF